MAQFSSMTSIVCSPIPSLPCAFALRRSCSDLCNQTNITKGLQGKFSVYHGAAVGLVRGKAGIQEYTDAGVNDPQVKRVREHTTAVGDPTLTEDQAFIEVELTSGEKLCRLVKQSLGNLSRPLTDKQLEAKFRDQAVVALPAAQVEKLIDQCWRIEELTDVGELIRATVPAGVVSH